MIPGSDIIGKPGRSWMPGDSSGEPCARMMGPALLRVLLFSPMAGAVSYPKG
jgi:hypothetical protein